MSLRTGDSRSADDTGERRPENGASGRAMRVKNSSLNPSFHLRPSASSADRLVFPFPNIPIRAFHLRPSADKLIFPFPNLPIRALHLRPSASSADKLIFVFPNLPIRALHLRPSASSADKLILAFSPLSSRAVADHPRTRSPSSGRQ
jgi:hypothetical protein